MNPLRFSLSLPIELHRAIKIIAVSEGLNVTAWIRKELVKIIATSKAVK